MARGKFSLIILIRPRSCTMTASASMDDRVSRYEKAWGSSDCLMRVFTVTYTFTPRSWAARMAALISDSEKLGANLRAPNIFPLR